MNRERCAIQRKEDEIMRVNMWNERDALQEARAVYVVGRAGMQCSYWIEEGPCDRDVLNSSGTRKMPCQLQVVECVHRRDTRPEEG